MKVLIIQELYDREDMPQVAKESLSSALQKLEQVGIPVKGVKVKLRNIKPLQKSVNKPKVLEISKSYRNGEVVAPMVLSEDGFIIDGHHRWLACLHVGKLEELVVQIGLPHDSALQAYSKIAENV